MRRAQFPPSCRKIESRVRVSERKDSVTALGYITDLPGGDTQESCEGEMKVAGARRTQIKQAYGTICENPDTDDPATTPVPTFCMEGRMTWIGVLPVMDPIEGINSPWGTGKVITRGAEAPTAMPSREIATRTMVVVETMSDTN